MKYEFFDYAADFWEYHFQKQTPKMSSRPLCNCSRNSQSQLAAKYSQLTDYRADFWEYHLKKIKMTIPGCHHGRPAIATLTWFSWLGSTAIDLVQLTWTKSAEPSQRADLDDLNQVSWSKSACPSQLAAKYCLIMCVCVRVCACVCV